MGRWPDFCDPQQGERAMQICGAAETFQNKTILQGDRAVARLEANLMQIRPWSAEISALNPGPKTEIPKAKP